MINPYKHANTHEIIESKLDYNTSWINVVDPTREEIETLMNLYNIPEDFIRDPLDSVE